MTTAIGIDPATAKPVALATFDTEGNVTTRKLVLTGKANGALRLMVLRSTLLPVLKRLDDVAVIVVEAPFGPQSEGLTNLVQCQGVLLECAQYAHPGAVVLDLNPGSWKKNSVGNGNASKAQYIEHAQGLGVDSDDEDLCAAACMAEAGLHLWLAEVERLAA